MSAKQQAAFGAISAGDTQALLAWVKEHNPKQYIKEGRLDQTRQPSGDPDCKLGVKHRRNTAPAGADGDDPPAPTTDAQPANQLQVGVDIRWGYASGIVVTRLPDGTEVVMAERTRPFNESDPSYCFPLMTQVEQRLGRKPRYGAWDTAFDAHAEALDILHPKLRRGTAIANRNTLTDVLINLRALARIRAAAPEGRPTADRLTQAA